MNMDKMTINDAEYRAYLVNTLRIITSQSDKESLNSWFYKDWVLGKIMLTKNPLEFDTRFISQLITGRKDVTFRRHADNRKIGDCFLIGKHVFQVTDISPINLETFIHRDYWYDGFETVPQAQEYYIKLYGLDAQPDTPDTQRDFTPTEYRKIDGYKFKFRQLQEI